MVLWFLKNTIGRLVGKLSPKEKEQLLVFVTAIVKAGAEGAGKGVADGVKNG